MSMGFDEGLPLFMKVVLESAVILTILWTFLLVLATCTYEEKNL